MLQPAFISIWITSISVLLTNCSNSSRICNYFNLFHISNFGVVVQHLFPTLIFGLFRLICGLYFLFRGITPLCGRFARGGFLFRLLCLFGRTFNNGCFLWLLFRFRGIRLTFSAASVFSSGVASFGAFVLTIPPTIRILRFALNPGHYLTIPYH